MPKKSRAIKVPDFSKNRTKGLKFSYKTGRLETHHKKLASKLVPKKEAGSFHKPYENDKLAEIGLSKIKFKQVPDNRVKTAIPGLDVIMNGGFERNSVNLIAGGPGSGKSIFCLQFLINGIDLFDEPAIYVTFEESKDKFYKHMKMFGWDLEKYEKQGKFALIEYMPAQVKALLEQGGGAIDSLITKLKAKRIVFDSLTAFTLLFKDELTRRQAVLDLFNLFSRWNITALLTSEQEPDPEKHTSDIMEFEVDGVILLYNLRKGDIRERCLEVFKLRGSQHAAKIFPMKITNKGVIIYPEETVF